MKKSLISFLETMVAGVLLSILIMLFVGQSLEITGDSMYPTLKNSERIIVEKVTYKNRQPSRGEILVFRSMQNDGIFLIKRVVGIPGDTLNLTEEGNVIVKPIHPTNQGDAAEEWADSRNQWSTETFGKADDLGALAEYASEPIPQGYIAVMGDNREESYDSRMFGLVPVEKIVGKAFVVYWPPANLRKISML